MTHPYEVHNIPAGDMYADTPLYGRYKATEGDVATAGLAPAEILALCGPDTDMIPDFPDGRHIYAIGDVIVKGRHDMNSITRSHAYGDANEAAAIDLVAKHFPWIPVPKILFQGKVILL